MPSSDEEGQPSSTTGTVAGAVEGAANGLGDNIGGLIDSDDPSDSTAEDVKRGFAVAGDVAGAAKDGAQAWGQAEGAARAARDGDTEGAVSGVLGAAGGTSGLVSENLDGIGRVTGDAGFSDAARVAGVVQAGAAFASRAVRQVADVIEQVTGGTGSQHVTYELHVEDAQGWVLESFSATEALNEPYELTLAIHTDDEDADPRSLVGRNVEVLIDRRDHTRRHCGMIRRVQEGSHRAHRVSATLTVVPALWSLSLGSSTRIFQERTVKQILEEVFSAALSPFRREVDVSGLEHDYPTREYCVQYRESPLAFCHRLMEEEGIGYYFDFDGDGWEQLVLFERNAQLEVAPSLADGPVPFQDGASVVSGVEPIVQMAASRQLVVTRVHVTDFDWTQSTTPIEATEGDEDERVAHEHGHGHNISHYDFSEGSNRYGQNDVSRQGQIRRQAHARDADTLAGVSMVTGLAPGRTFELSGHPVPGLDGEYLVTRVVHANGPADGEGGSGSGSSGAEDYHNRFECIPLSVPWRPSRNGPRPAVYGVQTAVVTGGNNGEIATDAYGRVRVQFHWDRDPDPERTSCWVRVAQTWGGHDGMGHTGFVFIPRVGMEVIVTFIDGDPDRPLLTGSVYNGTNLPPLGLPDQASRSVIRTRSTGGTGFNELSFEDASGNEEVHIHAERNMREIVKNDHSKRVHHDQKIEVDNDQFSHVKGNQFIQVDQDRVNVVEQNERIRVGGDQEIAVDGFRTETVHDGERVHVEGSRDVTIGLGMDGDDTLVVAANQLVQVKGTRSVDVWSEESHHARRGRSVTVEHGLTQTTSGGSTEEVTGDRSVSVQGESSHTATGDNTIEGQRIVLRAAQKIIVDAPNGIGQMSKADIETGSTLSSAWDSVTESVTGAKSSFTGLSFSETLVKTGLTGVSMGVTRLKIDNTGLSMKTCETINIMEAPWTIIG